MINSKNKIHKGGGGGGRIEYFFFGKGFCFFIFFFLKCEIYFYKIGF